MSYKLVQNHLYFCDVDGSHQLLERLCSSPQNASTIIYVILSDFQSLRNLREIFPCVNFLYLDLKQSVNVNKEFLACLPEFDVILNYSGESLVNSLHRVRNLKISK
jgi:hypothetical protein